MPKTNKRFGWRPDTPDQRDLLFASPIPPTGLPPMVNLREYVTEVMDQGNAGSCTANAISQAMMMGLSIQKSPIITPSRLFIYYNERVMEDSVSDDSGAEIRDGIKSVAKQGACGEDLWPYDVTAFATKPTDAAYTDAKNHQITRYMRLVPALMQLKGCLASGFPFVFGFSVYESFDSEGVVISGNVPMPLPNESMLGGHAVVGVGYNDESDIQLPANQLWPSQTFLVQNSWGDGWGLKGSNAGCFTIPYSYLTDSNLVDDFWTIREIETPLESLNQQVLDFK